MGDLVTCRSVLVHSVKVDYLYLCVPPDWKLRILPCRPKGQPKRTEGAEWEYEERDGKLHLTPSLLCLDTQFHTDFNWETAYEVCPADVGGYEHFRETNPTIEL